MQATRLCFQKNRSRIGVISGTLLNIDGAINRLAKSVETKFRKDDQNVSVAEGLVTATLLFCVDSILIIMIGTNLMGITKIKVADFLPAIIYAPIIYNIVNLILELI